MKTQIPAWWEYAVNCYAKRLDNDTSVLSGRGDKMWKNTNLAKNEWSF